jgi:hypothetical protein
MMEELLVVAIKADWVFGEIGETPYEKNMKKGFGGNNCEETSKSSHSCTMGCIGDLLIRVGDVQCNMTFIVVDTKNYDILLGLDLLIKIRVVVGVKIDLTLKQKCKYYHLQW